MKQIEMIIYPAFMIKQVSIRALLEIVLAYLKAKDLEKFRTKF